MATHFYLGPRHFGRRYFGQPGSAAGYHHGARYVGPRFFGPRYFGVSPVLAELLVVCPPGLFTIDAVEPLFTAVGSIAATFVPTLAD
jgi:hypothetical protein